MINRNITPLTPAELGITPPLIHLISDSPRLFSQAVEVLAGKPPNMDHVKARQCRDALLLGEAVMGLMCFVSGREKQGLFRAIIDSELASQTPELVWQA